MNRRLACLFLCIWLVAQAGAQAEPVVAHVTGGAIQGEKTGAITSFKGIPFAAPPVGPLRWRPPQPVKPWTSVRPTVAFAPGPMQGHFIARLIGIPVNFSEDCLYLNVWTPATNNLQKLPVMVWIYGGAFVLGSTAQPVYDGTHLAEKQVVVVSIAYRLGAFGFLAYPELTREGNLGNFGIRDQIAGLEWVRDNIGAFGGDPTNVTIFGESAGGMSVALLVTSPKARGLFQRAISESGPMSAPIPRARAEKAGQKFFAKLKVKDLAAARALPAAAILKTSSTAEVCCDEELLASDPYACLRAGRANETPILVGYNSNDGGLFVWGGESVAEFEKQVTKFFQNDAANVLGRFPHANRSQATHAAKELLRDAVFAWPAWKWARTQAERGTQPAYVYVFDQHSSFWEPEGAGHAAELGYVFNNPKQRSTESAALAEQMSQYWVNFARTGNPNGQGLPVWQPFTTSSTNGLHFGGGTRTAPLLDLPRYQALDSEIDRMWRRLPNVE